MQIIKSISARRVFKRFKEIKKELWGGEFWSDGGHIDTLSDIGGLEKIKKYVREQGRDEKQLKLLSFVK
jgi:putative transposase